MVTEMPMNQPGQGCPAGLTVPHSLWDSGALGLAGKVETVCLGKAGERGWETVISQEGRLQVPS